jgi:hypothetical protein
MIDRREEKDVEVVFMHGSHKFDEVSNVLNLVGKGTC